MKDRIARYKEYTAGLPLTSTRGAPLFADLLHYPPTAPHSSQRSEVLHRLDDWILEPDADIDPELIAYYRRAVDFALHILVNEPVRDGLRVFQLYSSSVVVQTPDVVFAIDLVPGRPVRSADAASSGSGFVLEPRQIEKLVQHIDYSFHTHAHADHLNGQLTQALLASGCTVIVPEPVKAACTDPWSEQLTVLDQTVMQPHQVGPLTVDVLFDRQRGGSEYNGTPCSAYRISTLENASILAKGDINCALRLYGWLQILAQHHRNVDLFVGSPIYWRGVPLYHELDTLLHPLWLPGHNWEFGHRLPGASRGNCSSFSSSYQQFDALAPGRCAVLSWGEFLDHRPGAS